MKTTTESDDNFPSLQEGNRHIWFEFIPQLTSMMISEKKRFLCHYLLERLTSSYNHWLRRCKLFSAKFSLHFVVSYSKWTTVKLSWGNLTCFIEWMWKVNAKSGVTQLLHNQQLWTKGTANLNFFQLWKRLSSFIWWSVNRLFLPLVRSSGQSECFEA